MTSPKEEAARLLALLPDDIGWAEFCSDLYLHVRVLQGLEDVKAGRTVPAEVIERKYGFKA